MENEQLTLGEMIDFLKSAVAERGEHYQWNGPCSPHSYRGFYDELSFERGAVTLGKSLEEAKNARGMRYIGWKGGKFLMDSLSPVWDSPEGVASGHRITREALKYMLSAGASQSSTPHGRFVVTGIMQVEFSIVVESENGYDAISKVSGMSAEQIRGEGHVGCGGEILESFLSASRER